MKKLAAFAAVLLACGALTLTAIASVDGPRSLRAFYFGNSLTGCTNPRWHDELGESAGKQWEAEAFLGAGWQLWQHRLQLGSPEDVFSTGPKGALTIDPEFLQSASYKARRFYEGGPWDAIVLQPFGQALERTVTQMWGKIDFEEPTDVGDISAASDIIELYLKTNPQGRVYIYADWPPMERGEVPPEDELPEWALRMRERRGSIRRAEFPDRTAFDYEREWLGKKFSPDHPDRPWLDNSRCRDYHYRLFEALKDRFPGLWRQGRLRMIPTGDIFMALERKMRAGQVPGIETIEDFYTDVQHIRAGLPRYTAAAAFYAVMFAEHPGALDWQLYTDPAAYGEDPHHDEGELLEITPERARIVNDTIWKVVVGHPHTRLESAKETSPATD
ncbi:MAG: hypothetical protein R6X33_09220 [Candidatus Brocadiia bacterium]